MLLFVFPCFWRTLVKHELLRPWELMHVLEQKHLYMPPKRILNSSRSGELRSKHVGSRKLAPMLYFTFAIIHIGVCHNSRGSPSCARAMYDKM